jgi:transposase
MWIIGCDFHPSYQQIAALNQETGEIVERRLSHVIREAEAFYESLPRGARIGMEATCTAQWFERLLDRCGHELQVGDPATIRAAVVRKQKTDTRDARHLLELLLTDRFPRIWIPTPAERDGRQLLWHRHKLVSWRTQVRNQLSALARNQGIFPRTRFWTRSGRQLLETLPLDPWAARRRHDLLGMLEQADQHIAELTREVEQQAQARADTVCLMQQSGVGPIVSLAFVLTLGRASRFRRGKQVTSYLGLNPSEHSSGGTQRLGHISKQGNSMMRWLLIEAAWTAARKDPQLRRIYQRLAFRRGSKIAAVAVARKLAVKLYWRLREFQEQKKSAQPAPMQGRSGSGLVNVVSSPSV